MPPGKPTPTPASDASGTGDEGDGGGSSSAGVMIGIGVAVLVVCVIVGVMLFIKQQRKEDDVSVPFTSPARTRAHNPLRFKPGRVLYHNTLPRGLV